MVLPRSSVRRVLHGRIVLSQYFSGRAYATATRSVPKRARPPTPATQGSARAASKPRPHLPAAAPTAKKVSPAGSAQSTTRSPIVAPFSAGSSISAPISPAQTVLTRAKLAAAGKIHTEETAEATAKDEQSPERMLAQLKRIAYLQRHMPAVDYWGMVQDRLDVNFPQVKHLPYLKRIGLLFTHPRHFLSGILSDIEDSLKSATRYVFILSNGNVDYLFSLAKVNVIPGTEVRSPYTLKMFGTTSTRRNAFLAPLRQNLLDTYVQLNRAIAERDRTAITRLTADPHQQTVLGLIAKGDPSVKYEWRRHPRPATASPASSDTPSRGILSRLTGNPPEKDPEVRVLSLRAMEYNLSKERIPMGSRHLVQMLVKFDTVQTLLKYHKDGSVTGRRKVRMVEYFVLERRMWYDEPWRFLEQIYP